jgi:YesN/AraC family two-component response regulator
MYTINFSEEETANAIIRKKEETVVEIFQNAVEKLMSVGADFSYIRTIFFQYTALLSRVSYSLHLSKQSDLSEENFQEITQHKTIPQMIEHIREQTATIHKTYLKEQSLDTNTRLIRDVENYLENNYDQNIGLETVADHFSISKYHLSRVFKKVTNQNFNEYLLSLRMEKAKALLRNPKFEIQEAAHAVGYSNSNSFRRVFKQRFGISPSSYQQRHRYAEEDVPII